MRDRVLELREFGRSDFAELLAVVPDAPFLLQWSGPQYVYPLDERQLEETLAKAEGEKT